MCRLRPSVLSRRGINFDSGESRGYSSRGYDTDGSTTEGTRQGRRRARGKCEVQRGERRNRAAASGRSVVAAARQEHTCNRWKAGIEHLVYFPMSSLARAEKNFIVVLPRKTACRDSIRNLKKWHPPRQVIRDVGFFGFVRSKLFVSFCFYRPTILSGISRTRTFLIVPICERGDCHYRQCAENTLVNFRDYCLEYCTIKNNFSMVHRDDDWESLALSEILRRFSLLRWIALSALAHLHSPHLVLWIGSHLKFSLPFEFSRMSWGDDERLNCRGKIVCWSVSRGVNVGNTNGNGGKWKSARLFAVYHSRMQVAWETCAFCRLATRNRHVVRPPYVRVRVA